MDAALDTSMVPSPRYEEEMLQHRDSDVWYYQTPRQPTSYDQEKEECGRDLVMLQSYKKRALEGGYPGDQFVYDEDRDTSYCVPDVENTQHKHKHNQDDDNIEEILSNMREAIDGWYHPKDTSSDFRRYKETKPKISDLFLDIQGDQHAPSNSPRRYPSFEEERISSHHNNKRLNHKKRKVPQSDEEPRLIESSDESEYKRNRKFVTKRSNMMEEVNNNNNNNYDDEDLTDMPICGKSGRAQIRKEYFYSKNSKTIFRWTCCGSQAKDHPNW